MTTTRIDLRFLTLFAAAVAVGSCGDGGPTDPGNEPTTGEISLEIGGLPLNAPAQVTVAGPDGFSTSVTATDTLAGLMPGEYSVNAHRVGAAGNGYNPIPASQTITVTVGAQATGSIFYHIATGRLAVMVSGLPAGVPALVYVTGPGGYARTLTASDTLIALEPGLYRVEAEDGILVSGNVYLASPAGGSYTVGVGTTPVPAAVIYSRRTATLDVSISGLPAGSGADVTVTGPFGYTLVLTANRLLIYLDPGTYTLTASAVTSGAATYNPQPQTQSLVLTAGDDSTASVVYSQSTATLDASISGLPSGTNADVSVTGPGGYSQHLTASQTLTQLVPGTYTIAGTAVTSGSATYGPQPPTQNVVLAAGDNGAASVVYSQSTASLDVTISGLPGGTNADVDVTGPGGYSQHLTASQTLTQLVPGTYTIAGTAVTSGSATYGPQPPTQNVVLAAGDNGAASVTYSQTTATLDVSISGLPGGASADVDITGPGGYNLHLTASQALTQLAPGTYTIAGTAVTSGSATYGPQPPTQNVVLAAGDNGAASVTYSQTTASLDVTISGLPGGTNADVDVTGPGGYNLHLTTSQLLTQLVPGTYTVTGSAVTVGSATYGPQPPTQNVVLAAGGAGNATVTYSVNVTVDFSIPTLYLIQSVQRPNGTVPLVAGRNAYLRVFATANQSNTSSPDVRIRLYQGAAVILDDTITAGPSGVPTSVNEGSLAASWDLLIPGSLIQPGLKVLAEVNPGAQVPEADPSDNNFPANGQPGALNVQTLPNLNITFIPVHQIDGSRGNITTGNVGQYTADVIRMFPVGGISTSVGVTYNFTGPLLQSSDGNGSWGQLLSEIHALRSSLPGTAYLYGVVHTNYGSGIAGLGYVPSSPSSTFKTAIGWDHLPSGNGVFAHELGHNFGRSHAPCGGPAGPDPNYPYPGGGIGQYGMDVAALSLKAPSSFKDLMSYCNPAWISDYNYEAVMNYRLASPLGAPPVHGGAVDGLLVWGRITNDTVVLEPAFRIQAPARLPDDTGPYRIEGYAADGSLRFSYAFSGVEAPDLPGGTQYHFAFVIPAGTEVSSLRLVTPRGTKTRRSAAPVGVTGVAPAPARPATASRIGGGRVRLDWDASAEPMVMVRDASGRIISFARGGSATILQPPGNKLDLQFSDGVKTRNAKVTIR